MRTSWNSTCCVLAAAVAVTLAVTSPAVAHVDLNAPSGGQVFDAGSVFTVEWEIKIGHNLQNWDLWYSTVSDDGPWIEIAVDLPAGSGAVGSIHTYDWTIPDIVSDDTWTRVRMDNSGTDYYGVSDASFRIVPEPDSLLLLLLGLGAAGVLWRRGGRVPGRVAGILRRTDNLANPRGRGVVVNPCQNRP